MPVSLDIPCKNDRCFACLRGKCYALNTPEFNEKGSCPFFKTEVDLETKRRIYPRPEKFHVDYAATASITTPKFEKWFIKEWNDATLYLLANHRQKLSEIPITLEL